MTKSTVLSQKQTFQRMIARADADLAQLHKQEQEARRNLSQAAQEQQALSQRAIARADQLQTAQNDVQRLQEAVEQKRAGVSIAEGTGAHGALLEALHALQRELEKATQHLQKVEVSTSKEEQADTGRRETIAATIQREQARLAQITEKQASIAAAGDRAHEDLGQAELAEVLALVEILQKHVAAKQQQLHQAEEEFEDRLQQSIDRLADWPDLQRQVSILQVPRDASTDLLEAQLALLTILIERGPEAWFDSFLVQQALDRRFMTLESLLALDEQSIIHALRGVEVDVLDEKRGQARKVLEAYRDSKRGEANA